MNQLTQSAVAILPLLAAGLVAGVGCSSSGDNLAAVGAVGGWPSTVTGGTTGKGGATSQQTGGFAPGTGGAETTGGAGGGAALFNYPDGFCGKAADGTTDIAKNVSCTSNDPVQVCDKNCGPGNVGYKTETCNGTLYTEGTCTFPAEGNYGCFKVPADNSAGCPGTVPQHNGECPTSMAICQTAPIGTACQQATPCDMCGVGYGYLDSGGASKGGYCVCVPSTTSATGQKWACASATAWPCPASNGC